MSNLRLVFRAMAGALTMAPLVSSQDLDGGAPAALPLVGALTPPAGRGTT